VRPKCRSKTERRKKTGPLGGKRTAGGENAGLRGCGRGINKEEKGGPPGNKGTAKGGGRGKRKNSETGGRPLRWGV